MFAISGSSRGRERSIVILNPLALFSICLVQILDRSKGKVKALIYDFLFSEETGLPLDGYDDDEIKPLSDQVFLHIFERYEDGGRTAYTDLGRGAYSR